MNDLPVWEFNKATGVPQMPGNVLTFAFLVAALVTCEVARAQQSSPEPVLADWTIMVYLNADNNLEPFGIRDFLEMAEIGSTEKVHIIVQFDRIPGHSSWPDSERDWTETLRFRVEKDMLPLKTNALPLSLGEADMGDGRCLTDFVDWAMKEYPAKRYMLDIWNHGQGWRFFNMAKYEGSPGDIAAMVETRLDTLALQEPSEPERFEPTFQFMADEFAVQPPIDQATFGAVRSVSNDDTTPGDALLYNREIQDAMKQLLKGRKLDLLGFDACLMGMLETAFAMRDVADVMVASEELEPGPGWNYATWLRKLVAAPDVDGRNLGILLVEAYENHYTGRDGETTLAAVDLALSDDVANAFSVLADNLIVALDQELNSIRTARSECYSYAPDYGMNGIDAARFCDRVAAATGNEAIRTSAAAAAEALRAMVLRNYAGSARQGSYGSHGLAIYYPVSKVAYDFDADKKGYAENNTEFPVEFVQRHRWVKFLHAYFQRVPK